MQSGLVLGLFAISSYAAPANDPIRPLAIQARQDANSYALPELCYFDGEKEEDKPPPKRSLDVSKRAGPVYAPSHKGQSQVVAKPKWDHFHALGDSFSAGPGAGEYYGEDGGKFEDWCYRSKGSYAYQLIANNDEEDRFKLGGLASFQFLSCTGHVTKDVVKYQLPLLDFGEEDTQMTVSLSIGGNDLGFSHVIKTCLLDKSDLLGLKCKWAMDGARDLMRNKDNKNTFRDGLFQVWRGLKNPDTNRYPMVAHTLYPTFFNAEFANCNDVRLLKVGNALTRTMRRNFNELVSMANKVITDHAMLFQTLNPLAQGRIFPISVDEYYEGHRLCEPYVKDLPGFSDPDVYFLGVGSSDATVEDGTPMVGKRSSVPTLDEIDPNTCDPNHPHIGVAWGCEMVKYNQTVDHDVLQDVDKRTPLYIIKAFHPTTAGFTATVNAIKEQLPRQLGSTLRKRDVVPGEIIGGDLSFNGTLPANHVNPKVSYPIKAALSGMVACTNQIETYMSNLGEAHVVALDESPNLVLMYDGVGEVMNASDDDSALKAWSTLYKDLRDKVGKKVTILVGTLLPPPNLSTDMQKRFVTVNDRMAAQLKDIRTINFEKVLVVDLSQIIAGPDADEMGVSVAKLDTRAYIDMLGAWRNGATHAAVNLGWMEEKLDTDPNLKAKPSKAPSPTSTAAPGPTGPPICNGNDVKGDCIPGPLGPLKNGARYPVCNKAFGNNPTSKLMSESKARELASSYCRSLVDKKVVLNKDSTLVSPFVSDGAVDGGRITASVLFDKESCAEGLSEGDQKVDFKAMGLDKCFEYMFTTLNTYCRPSKQGGTPDGYQLLGGVWGKDCALWSLRGN